MRLCGKDEESKKQGSKKFEVETSHFKLRISYFPSMFQYPEEPASGDDAGHKPDKAFDAVAELLAHAFFLGDAKDDGSKECK